MIFGYTKDEGMLFVNEIFLDPINKVTLQAILALQFGDNATAILDHANFNVSKAMININYVHAYVLRRAECTRSFTE